MTTGRTIRIFLVDGSPTGIWTAEIMNWTGFTVTAPRSRIADLVKREDIKRTGIYLLTGPDPDAPNKTLAYIGESDNVAKRLAQHNKDEEKDFWDRACVIVSKDQNLTKAHARYLESRLISITTEAKRFNLTNSTAPDYGYLPESDISDMEFFIEQVGIVLPVLGLEMLRKTPKITFTEDSSERYGHVGFESIPSFELFSPKFDLKADAREIDGEFIVTKGSFAQSKWIGSEGHNYHQLYDQLFKDGKIAADPVTGLRIFQDDVSFNSPSAAAAVIYGRASNGRTSWKVQGTKQTYAQWQEAQVGDIVDDDE